MFYNCSSLISLPDISNWNTNYVIDISMIFSKCISLSSFPDISKWNTDYLIGMKSLFSDSISLLLLPDISKFNNYNENDINETLDYQIKRGIENYKPILLTSLGDD